MEKEKTIKLRNISGDDLYPLINGQLIKVAAGATFDAPLTDGETPLTWQTAETNGDNALYEVVALATAKSTKKGD